MDRTDKWSVGAMLLLAFWFIRLTVSLDAAMPGFAERKTSTAAQAVSPEYGAKLKIAANLLQAGNMDQLKNLLDEMITAYPYQAGPFMLLGDYYIRKQQPVAAMHAFRQALDLNLDYLEKRSSMYQGKKIKNIVAEAEEEITLTLAADPGDAQAKENRRELYYMMRKLAGGCGD